MHILNEVFDYNVVLLASFVTTVDYSVSYEPTGLSFFCNSCNYFFSSCLPKSAIISLNLLRLWYWTPLPRIQWKRHFRWRHNYVSTGSDMLINGESFLIVRCKVPSDGSHWPAVVYSRIPEESGVSISYRLFFPDTSGTLTDSVEIPTPSSEFSMMTSSTKD